MPPAKIKSAVMDVKLSQLGRKPVKLPSGKLLAEARAIARANVKAARNAVRPLKATTRVADKARSAAVRDVERADRLLAFRLNNPRTRYSKAAQRAELAKLRGTAREATKALKAAIKAFKREDKLLAAAEVALSKAQAAQLNVEQQHLAAPRE